MARIAAPGLLLGLAGAGVVQAAAGPAAQETVAVPASVAPVATAPSPRAVRDQGTSRDSAELRSALPSPSATAAPRSTEQQEGPKPKPKPKPEKEKEKKEKEKAEPKVLSLEVVDRPYTRVDLNVRAKDDADSELLTVLEAGSRLRVTATVRGEWRYISYRGEGAWVRDRYLTDDKPAAATGLSSARCASGSKVESGLTPDAVRVHRAICARYPSVTSYGGVRADSLPEHPSGRALDAMTSDTDLGWQVARWVRANAKQLGVSEILYAQHIWTVQRSREGWRSFPDRGSATANHYDHVHVSVYGSSGG